MIFWHEHPIGFEQAFMDHEQTGLVKRGSIGRGVSYKQQGYSNPQQNWNDGNKNILASSTKTVSMLLRQNTQELLEQSSVKRRERMTCIEASDIEIFKHPFILNKTFIRVSCLCIVAAVEVFFLLL